jgi:FKBP-type peptidyl-prolyl cis-trans isomerase FkpA
VDDGRFSIFLRVGSGMGKKLLVRSILAAFFFSLVGGCSKVDPEQNLKAGESFLAENRTKEGVVTTPSGLQYQVLKDGNGKQPSASDSVTVNYKGSLITGKEFDSGENITFPLNGVIPGWTEGLQLMKEGAKYRFFIPSPLAYGESGAARVIPPNAALIFEVDLVKVNR